MHIVLLSILLVYAPCPVSDTEPLPDTITKLYARLTWTLASASIKSNDPHENSLEFSGHKLLEERQQSWWQVCELAFTGNIQKGHKTFSKSDIIVFKKISKFGLKHKMESFRYISVYPYLSFILFLENILLLYTLQSSAATRSTP